MDIIKDLCNMKKLSLVLLLTLPSISAIAATPTQQALDAVNKQCGFQVNHSHHYLGCTMVTAHFPFLNDKTFQKKFFDVLKQSGFTYTGDPIAALDGDISPQRIYNSSVITPLISPNTVYALIDKKGVEYGMSVYYAPHTNKLVIMPHGMKGDVSHKWLGDVKDSNLKKSIIHDNINTYNVMKAYASEGDFFNSSLREIKVNLGVDVKFDGFKNFNPNYRLSYER